jgi:hypothetical protein
LAGRVRFATAGADAAAAVPLAVVAAGAVVPLGATADPAGVVATAAAVVGAAALAGAPPVVAWAFGVSVAVLPPHAASSRGTAMQSAASSPRGRGTGERNVVRIALLLLFNYRERPVGTARV